jgi:hypothetical protein
MNLDEQEYRQHVEQRFEDEIVRCINEIMQQLPNYIEVAGDNDNCLIKPSVHGMLDSALRNFAERL